jgi:hypothetical protein
MGKKPFQNESISWPFWPTYAYSHSWLPIRPKPNVRVMKGNSVNMTDILHQKAFEMHALEASRVTDTSLVLAVFVSSIICFIKQKTAQMSSLSHSDTVTIQSNLWNYRAKWSLFFRGLTGF